jgi:DNA-binding response OmpR family regulator/CBS domain-containing protein
MATVKELMTRDVLTVGEDDFVEKVAALILQHDVSGVPVVDSEKRLVGIVTEFALLDVLFRPEKRRDRVGTVMTRNVLTVREDATPREVSQLLISHRVRRVPVVRDERLVGIVSRRDLIRFATIGHRECPPHPAHAASPPLTSDRSQLLVVDDSRIIHEMIRDTLQPLHFDITYAVEGAGVLDMARNRAFDLILLDRVLPDIDGLELLQQLHRDPATQNIPVIMVTSCDLATHVAEAIDAGAADYIRKPFSPMEIRARVRGVLRTYRLQRDLLSAKSDAHAMPHDRGKCLEAGCDDFITKPIDRTELVQLVARHHGGRRDATMCASTP